jgi:hypothetical protein
MTGALAGPCDAAVASSVATCANRHPVATLAATILGSSLAFVDGSVVNVALAAFERDLGAGPSGLAWIINAYLLPLGTTKGGGGCSLPASRCSGWPPRSALSRHRSAGCWPGARCRVSARRC